MKYFSKNSLIQVLCRVVDGCILRKGGVGMSKVARGTSWLFVKNLKITKVFHLFFSANLLRIRRNAISSFSCPEFSRSSLSS